MQRFAAICNDLQRLQGRRLLAPRGPRTESSDLASMANVEASVASHRSNHLIINSHHPSASIHQTIFTSNQIQHTTKRRGHATTPRHTAGQLDRPHPSLGRINASHAHTASPRLARPLARTHARTKRIRFPGWTHNPNLRYIYQAH